MSAGFALRPTGAVPLSTINPVAQLTGLALVSLTLLTTLDLVTPAIVVAAELLLVPAAGIRTPAELLRRTWPLLLGASMVGLVNVVIGPGTGPLLGLGLALRVIGLALPGVLLVASTDPVRMADALTTHWRLSTRFGYGALAGLRLVPLLLTELSTIRLARRTRGVGAGRNPLVGARLFAGAVFTLLVGAIRRGSRLATAMDARGFDSGVRRTNARGSVLYRRDWLYVGAVLAVCGLATAVSLAAGTWSPIFVGG